MNRLYIERISEFGLRYHLVGIRLIGLVPAPEKTPKSEVIKSHTLEDCMSGFIELLDSFIVIEN